MTDSDIRTLKRYLTERLEPRLKMAEDLLKRYVVDERDAKARPDSATTLLDVIHAQKMQHHWRGRAAEVQHAIDDFKDLFEEELKEGE